MSAINAMVAVLSVPPLTRRERELKKYRDYYRRRAWSMKQWRRYVQRTHALQVWWAQLGAMQ